ncbi:MAG: glutathione S-transferase family protein [Caulobacterales bacterium]
MLIVHHLGISQSERVVWLCEELGVPYELKLYTRDPVTRLAPAAYKALHPFGTAPVITDGDLVLGESGAIIEYIINKYGGGRLAVAPDKPNYSDYLFWWHFTNGSITPAQMMVMMSSMLGEGHAWSGVWTQRNDNAFAMLETRLGKTPYLAGPDLTAADIMLVYNLTTMRQFAPHDLAAFPNIRAYLKRIGERPAYQRAMAKAEPGQPLNLS